MIQIKKTILTLVALLAVTTSAWAESKPIGLNVEYAVGDVITTNSTGDVYVWWGIHSGDQEWVIKITSSVTPTISELGIVESSGFITLDDDYDVYDMNGNLKAYSYKIHCQGEVTGTTLEKVYVASGSGTLTDPYVFGSGPSGNPFPITWSATTPNTASIAAMPAGNVTVKVKYFAQAELATSTGESPVPLAPAAIASVPANTDDPIVTAGTVANIGTSEVKQGTLKYFVKQADGNTAPTAPDYDDDGWTDKVPTADGLAQGKAYVWYYIKGAEPAQGTDRTDDNTRSDSDIMPLGTTGFVTLEAEPTYAVTLNDEGLSTDEAAAWKVAKGTDDPAAFPLEGVKKGQTVTVTYTGNRHVKGVKAEKKSSAPTLKDALADGATVVINYTWDDGTFVTTFTFTNNGGTYTGNTTGFDAKAFGNNSMSIDGTTLKFAASNTDYTDANVSIDFYTDTNEYVISKGGAFTSFTISVNGTDLTSQLKEVK